MHSIAATCPAEPNASEQAAYAAFYNTLAHVLPCPSCRQHYLAFLQSRPVETVFNTTAKQSAWPGNIQLQSWVCDLHNDVNLNTGKPVVALEDVMRAYHTRCFDQNGSSKMATPFILGTAGESQNTQPTVDRLMYIAAAVATASAAYILIRKYNSAPTRAHITQTLYQGV